MMKTHEDLESILDEFQIAESLYDRGYIKEDEYTKYKTEVAARLIQTYQKKPWWKIW